MGAGSGCHRRGQGGDRRCAPWVTRWGRWQGNPRFSEEFVTHLETELEQSRLRESETLSALKEMQDKVLDMEKVMGTACGCHAGGPRDRVGPTSGPGECHTSGLGDRDCHTRGLGGSWTWCPLSLGIPSATQVSPGFPLCPGIPCATCPWGILCPQCPPSSPPMPYECPHLHLAEGDKPPVPAPWGVPTNDQCHRPKVSLMTSSDTALGLSLPWAVPTDNLMPPPWVAPTPGCPH